MDQKAVNYIFKMPAGGVYHTGDSHYSICYAEIGKKFPDIDIVFWSLWRKSNWLPRQDDLC